MRNPRLGILLLLPALALAACASPFVTVHTSTPATTDTSTQPSPEASTPTSEPVTDLDFDPDPRLDSTWLAEWSNGMMADDGYTLTAPDDGNGSWTYRHEASQCGLRFWQGSLTGFDTSKGDQSLSDQVLANVFGAAEADVTPHAQTVALPTLGGGGTASARAVPGSGSDGAVYLVVARGFGAMSSGLTLTIDCPGEVDPTVVYDEVSERGFSLFVHPLFD